MTNRPLCEIGDEIAYTWPRPYFGAVPYIEALRDLNTIDEMHGLDSAKSIVLYFLSNATTWRGEDARRIKAELKSHLKGA